MDDDDIGAALAARDPRAVAALSDRYRERLVAHAHRVLHDWQEAEDVVQEVFLRTPKAVRLRDGGSLVGWLYAVCYRVAVDKLRARNRRARAIEALGLLGKSGPATADWNFMDQGDEVRRARAALDGLDEPYRTAVTLRYLHGLEFRELAGRMGTIERTARTWVGRGLTRLRERLGASG